MLSILRVYISAATQRQESSDFVTQKLNEIIESGNDILASVDFA
jgi:hypothetical protein